MLSIFRHLQQTLTPGLLTVRAQTVDPTDNGQLLWDVFMPRQNIPSTTVKTYTTQQFRPASDRREWNQRGRLIPRKFGPIAEISLTPTEAFFAIDEVEMQKMVEEVRGDEAVIRGELEIDIPERSDGLVLANSRRIELDAFEAWALGQFTATDPVDGTAQVFSYGFDATRYQTAAPTWAAAANAYDAFLTWITDGIARVGNVEGAKMRQATLNAILADTAHPLGFTYKPTIRQLEERISDDIGSAFTITVNERTVERFTGGGLTTAATKVWAAQRVALIPAGGTVGVVGFAPVVRAFEISAAEPAAKIDKNGMTVYMEELNAGRDLKVECQVNQIPLPDEQKLWVINAGV